MNSFNKFLRWNSNQKVVPTMEAFSRKTAFCRNKDIDTLKLGSTLLNLAIICLHKSRDTNY